MAMNEAAAMMNRSLATAVAHWAADGGGLEPLEVDAAFARFDHVVTAQVSPE
jgi:hypothetical protein